MIDNPVIWHVEGGVGRIILNRPQAANVIDSATGLSLAAAIARAATSDIGALLISSRGRLFCAGGDINEFSARRDDLNQLVGEMLSILHPAIHQLATLPLPVVSAVQGPVGGAGIAIALCADVVLAAPTMTLRGGYSAIGLSPDLGASYYLARRAGPARAKRLLMTNRAMTAEECLACGIVDELHDLASLEAAATALAGTLAAGATRSLGEIKQLCDSAVDHDLNTHLSLEREAMLRCAVSTECHEGVRAFVEKRAPCFVRERRI